MDKSINKNFMKYVSLNVMGMIGLSCYILADTFLVSKNLGAIGIASLNFSISIYSIIHGAGLMIGIGGATRYSILKSQKQNDQANKVFDSSMKLGLLVGIIFVTIGIFGSESLATILGADEATLPLIKIYLTTILIFSPFFIANNIILAFVRNDHNPKLAMTAMLMGSLSNIILDYIFIFPLGMGMFGAALATSLAPIISMIILSIHFITRSNEFRYTNTRLSSRILIDICSLGLSALITEVSSAVILITFNLVILRITGNLGVASYGIVANIALVVISIFTGIALGIQPIVSKSYGLKNYGALLKIRKYALFTSFLTATVIYFSMVLNADSIIELFNRDLDLRITEMAKIGIKIYFIGFFFAGMNIVMAIYLSATERPRDAFTISISRGIIIVAIVLVLSRIWEMKGVWLAFVVTEASVTIGTMIIAGVRKKLSAEEMISVIVESE